MDNKWAIGELDTFVDLAQSRNDSGNGFITNMSYAVTPRDQVVTQQAVVTRILDIFTPSWRDDHEDHPSYEFGKIRDAALAALSVLRREEEIAAHLDPPAPSLSSDNLHAWVWEPARPLWRDGHFRAAVQTAATGLDARLQDFTGRRDIFGKDLAAQCLSDDPPRPGRPRLRVPDQGHEQTTRSVQDGLRALGAACYQLARNPNSHRVDDLPEQEALELMAMLSLFARTVETCTVETVETL